MKWFKHDTDASIDAKLQELLLDYGATGYGLYWYCVELIAQNVDEQNITFELEHDVRIIARNLNLTLQETKDMMQKMIELDLFSMTKNSKLACYTLAKRLDQSMTSNKGFRAVISKIKEQSHDEVMISHDKVMQEESRREESRREEIIVQKQNTGEAKEIIEHLNQVCKTNFKHTSKKTQDLIKARINEGFTLEDFKHVHLVKASQWLKDANMVKFLRPETLYSNKFEGYRNEKIDSRVQASLVMEHSNMSASEMRDQMLRGES